MKIGINTETAETVQTVGIQAVVHERLVSRLYELPEDARHAIYVDANRYEWPGIFADIKPEGWQEMNNKERYDHPSSKVVWDAIQMATTEFGRSRAWWTISLEETPEAHLEWWNNGRRRVDPANKY
jgi:hypothetical protein